MNELMTYNDVANLLKCCVKHVRDKYVKTGMLKVVHLGSRAVRFRHEDVQDLVNRLTCEPESAR